MQMNFGKIWDARKTFRSAISILNDLGDGGADTSRCRRSAMAFYKTVMAGPGQLTDDDLQEARTLLRDLPQHEINELIKLMQSVEVISVDDLASGTASLPTAEKHRLLDGAVKLAVRTGRLEENRGYLNGVARAFQYDQDDLDKKIQEISVQEGNRRKLIRSGAGVLAALLVLTVFVITATLLQSVIFGLILAYIVLPLEQYFFRRLGDRRSLLFRLTALCTGLTAPLSRLAEKLRRQPPLSPEQQQKNEHSSRITRAVSLAALTFFVTTAALLIIFSILIGNYVSNLKEKSDMRRAAAAQTDQTAPATAPTSATAPATASTPLPRPVAAAMDSLQNGLERLRTRFDQMPLVQYGVDVIDDAINDPATQEKLLHYLLQRSSGMVSVTTGVLAAICSILADLLLTVFFFLLFLHGMARFCAEQSGADRPSEYLVRTVLNGNWLPGVREETVTEAARIISGIINRLKVWVRGYLTLILVDSTVYTTLFYLLDVPYFFILGPFAGCCLLLPYIGPIASGILTVLVTLAVGTDVPTGQIIGIICCYLIYNGVIEQFILYPLVIGESIGLTTLETIIVVLLGAIFAGITGMILALPAASILKYLVPQIYHCFDRTGGFKRL